MNAASEEAVFVSSGQWRQSVLKPGGFYLQTPTPFPPSIPSPPTSKVCKVLESIILLEIINNSISVVFKVLESIIVLEIIL